MRGISVYITLPLTDTQLEMMEKTSPGVPAGSPVTHVQGELVRLLPSSLLVIQKKLLH